MEFATVTKEDVFEELKVFDRSVVDEGYAAVFAEVGMSVAVGGFAVCGPSGVGDADARVEFFVFAEVLQVGDFSHAFVDTESTFGAYECNSGAVVATVFKAVETADEVFINVSVSNVSNYSTHISNLI